MKRIILLGVALFSIIAAEAQTARVYRSEFITYDKREDATADKRSETARYLDFEPVSIDVMAGEARYMQKFEIDASMNDYNLFFHIENHAAAFTLYINNQLVAEVEDPITPADFMVSRFLRQGVNEILICMRESKTPQLQEGIAAPKTKLFDNSYLFAQRRLSVRDFSIMLEPDSTRKFAQLKMDVIVANDFNFEETIQVGYDIYNPKGKLMDFSVNSLTLDGRSMDTLSFKPYIYHAYDFKWGEGQRPLYSVMLYIKRNGMLWEYIPLKIGFSKTEFRDGKFYRFDKVVNIREKRHFNATADRQQTQKLIEQMRANGFNTLCPDYPQPKWFYDMCDKVGMYVIDCANISSPSENRNRAVGGTPANDPKLLDEYMERVKTMYYRSRNHTCIIGFALSGKDSGNGYNMYKAYEWLKSVENRLPVFYEGADGEWNTDNIL